MSQHSMRVLIALLVFLFCAASVKAQPLDSALPVPSARGTLISMFPTKDGLVLAADEAIGNAHGALIGHHKKIYRLTNDNPANDNSASGISANDSSHALAATGISTYYTPPPEGVTQDEWILSGKGTLFDAEAIPQQVWEK